MSWGRWPPGNDDSDARANTGGGTAALTSITRGGQNTAYGYRALENNDGFFNTAIGVEALVSDTNGNANTASGYQALYGNISGDNNTALSYQAGINLRSGDANVYLAHRGGTSESRTMRLGQNLLRTFVSGVYSAPLSGSPRAVFISDTGQLGVQPSSARYKRDIQPMGAHSQGLFQLRPVTFRYTADASGVRQYGLIAEEVVQVYPELVTRGPGGEVEAVQYHALIPLLLHAVQQQQQALDVQAQQLMELQAENARLRTLAERTTAQVSR